MNTQAAGRLFRFSPSRVALGYVVLGVLALALFALPLWHAWRDNVSTFRAYVQAEELQRLTEAFGREGANGAAAAMDSMIGSAPGDQVMILADASKRRLAGNLPAWPAEVPDAPGTYGLAIGLGGAGSMRVVATHTTLPGGYHLLMGRESVRFESLVERFWYGIAAAMGIVLVLGVAAGWLIRRAHLSEVDEIGRAARARFQGILEIAEDAIISVDARENIALFNRGAEKVFGYAEDEVLGKPLDILLPERFVQAQRREVLARRKDGGEFPAEASISKLDLGGEVLFTVILRDVTQRRQAEQELQKQRAYFDELLELAPAAIVLSQLNPSRVVRVNREFTRMFGYTAEEALGRSLRELIAPGELQPGYAKNAESIIAGQKMETEVVRQRKDGSRFHAHLTASRVILSDGTVTAYLVYRDITETKRTQEELKRSEERYALAMEAARDGHWDWIVETDEFYASPQLLEIYGFPADTVFAGRADFLARFPFHPEDKPKWEAAAAAHFAGKTVRFGMELRILRQGEVRWIRLNGLCLRDAAGALVRWTGSVRDVTESKRAEAALRESSERYALAVEAAGEGHSDWNLETGEFHVSPRLLEICGYAPGTTFESRAEWVGRFPFHPEDRPKWEQAVAAHLAGRASRFQMEARIVVRGETRWVRFVFLSSRDASGKAVRWTGSTTDVTDRKRAEEALRLSEARYALAMEAAQDGHWDWIVGTDEYYVSPRDLQLYGLSADTPFASREDFFAGLPLVPEDREQWMRAMDELFAGSGSRLSMELRANVNGGTRWIQFSGVCARDASGKPLRWSGTSRDVTDRKRAETALREFEKQLRQAQRLEAVGTLASGIAHDFNNILGAILGYGEMALRDAPGGSRLKRDLDSVMVAGERGRALVDRILAFSRSGMVERVAVHVEPIVREVLHQLASKLPAGVNIESKLEAGRAAILGDPTQVHQVLMNLATNSLQAMASGGVLRVSLEAVRLDEPLSATTGLTPAGECLVLTVADSGVGIPSEISERIFDPFFTTKEAGVGTGLGLSLVHGIVTELGGAVDVRSVPGSGSTFTVYLPCSGEAPEEEGTAETPMPHGNRQRVLIVDDEESLVALATRTLEGLGYVAVGFTSSSAALEAFRAHPEDFDALITDERMPGMSGSTLIREVRGIRRAIPILLASGYVGRGVAGRAYNSGADEVLKKPLLERDLAASLARVLHS